MRCLSVATDDSRDVVDLKRRPLRRWPSATTPSHPIAHLRRYRPGDAGQQAPLSERNSPRRRVRLHLGMVAGPLHDDASSLGRDDLEFLVGDRQGRLPVGCLHQAEDW